MRTSGRRISTQGGNGREIQMHPKSATSAAINDSALRIHSTASATQKAQDENSLNSSTKRAAITSLDYQYSANKTAANMLQAKFCSPFSSDSTLLPTSCHQYSLFCPEVGTVSNCRQSSIPTLRREPRKLRKYLQFFTSNNIIILIWQDLSGG